MNAVTISILSLLLALTASGSGDVATKKATDSQEQLQTAKDRTDGSFWDSVLGVNLNHNETLRRISDFISNCSCFEERLPNMVLHRSVQSLGHRSANFPFDNKF